jgi:hypothetical protein
MTIPPTLNPDKQEITNYKHQISNKSINGYEKI